jgi:hypothetical protein
LRSGEIMKLSYGISLLVAGVVALQASPLRAALDFNNYDALHLNTFRFSQGTPQGDWLNPTDMPSRVSGSTSMKWAGGYFLGGAVTSEPVPVFDFGGVPAMVMEPSAASGGSTPAGPLASTAPATRKGTSRISDGTGVVWGTAVGTANGIRQISMLDIASQDAGDSTAVLGTSTMLVGAIGPGGVSSASAMDATTLVSASAFLITAGMAVGALRRRQ